jgi:hypothetical protein
MVGLAGAGRRVQTISAGFYFQIISNRHFRANALI